MQPSPCIRFNKEGTLLAVSSNDNGVKILANSDGIRLLRTVENRSFDASRVAPAAIVKVKALYIYTYNHTFIYVYTYFVRIWFLLSDLCNRLQILVHLALTMQLLE